MEDILYKIEIYRDAEPKASLSLRDKASKYIELESSDIKKELNQIRQQLVDSIKHIDESFVEVSNHREQVCDELKKETDQLHDVYRALRGEPATKEPVVSSSKYLQKVISPTIQPTYHTQLFVNDDEGKLNYINGLALIRKNRSLYETLIKLYQLMGISESSLIETIGYIQVRDSTNDQRQGNSVKHVRGYICNACDRTKCSSSSSCNKFHIDNPYYDYMPTYMYSVLQSKDGAIRGEIPFNYTLARGITMNLIALACDRMKQPAVHFH